MLRYAEFAYFNYSLRANNNYVYNSSVKKKCPLVSSCDDAAMNTQADSFELLF